MPNEDSTKEKVVNNIKDNEFSQTPKAPVHSAPATSAAPSAKETQGESRNKTKQISVGELIKMINAPKPEKPLEKPPVGAIILKITGSVFASVLLFISFVVAYFYFRGAVGSFIITLLFGICSSLFVLSAMFMICRIEEGIRQIKTKL